MTIIGLDHVQLAAPSGCESEARRFYGVLLGLEEVGKPPALAGRGGVWFVLHAGQQVHIGVEAEFAPARKAHPGFAVSADQLDALLGRLRDAGVEVDLDDGLSMPGVRRFHAHDPFGNRLEFIGT